MNIDGRKISKKDMAAAYNFLNSINSNSKNLPRLSKGLGNQKVEPNHISGQTSLGGSSTQMSGQGILEQNLSLQSSIISNQVTYHYLITTPSTSLSGITGDAEGFNEGVYSTLPPFIRGADSICIPKKVKKLLEDFVSRDDLRTINPDIDVAIELCLLLLSNLSDTHFLIKNAHSEREKEGWKHLYSTLLHQQTALTSEYVYSKIIKVLRKGTKKGPIIERDDESKYHHGGIGSFSYSYRLGDAYRAKGGVTYKLKTEKVLGLQKKAFYKKLAIATTNPIARNLLNIYYQYELPTKEQIKRWAKEIIKQKYHNKRGMKLIFKNNHKPSRFKGAYRFVEDDIELFEHLTREGFMIPSVCGEEAGGRVIDSFTLMPSWIRKLIKKNGEELDDCDFKALHPNITIKLYGGQLKYITHQMIADEIKGEVAAEEEVNKVKKAHLSYFNDSVGSMPFYLVHNFYQQFEPDMMWAITRDKWNSIYGHKITSRKLFKSEVDIMTDIITQLNAMGIYVGYIYDALLCTKAEKEIVKKIMNETILRHGIYTVAK